jgi:cytochrome P450
MSLALDQYDYFGADLESIRDPYAFLERAREQGPIYHDPVSRVFVVLGYDAITRIAKDASRFSSINSERGPMSEFPGAGPGQTVPEALAAYREEFPNREIPLLTLDPPHHTRMRTLCGKLFTPRRMAAHERRMQAIAARLFGDLAPSGHFEWIRGFAHPMAFLVVCELFGIPEDDQEMLLAQEQAAVRQLPRPGSPSSLDAEVKTEMAAAQRGRYEYFAHHLSDRRAQPRDDVMSEFVNTPYTDTGKLPELEALNGIAATMYGAGQETTVHLFASGMRILCQHPEIQNELRANPELMPRFVEEVLRVEPPVKGLSRLAVYDVEIEGTKIPAGATVHLSWAAGNRDPAQFANPEKFDIHRKDWRGNLAFGHGPHSCLGGPLARLEATVGFNHVLAKTENVRIAPDAPPLEYLPTFVLRALKELWIEVE